MVISNLILVLTLAQAEPPPAPAASESSALAVTSPSDSSVARVSITAGIIEYKKRKYAQAEADFERALKADPGSAAAAYYLGYTIYKRVEKKPFHPDKTRAARLFDQAFTADPSFRPDWGRSAASSKK
jgi:tetratricopeptide (TPR) repeat protein